MSEDLEQGWQRLQPRHLLALRAVRDTGSFRGAAAALGYGLSTLSDQIATLERLVGQPLLLRPGGRRAVSLTPAGHALLEHADPILAQVAATRTSLEAVRHRRAVLRLGLFQTVGARLLPAVLRALARDRPDLVVELTERADDGELLARLTAGELDVAFVALPVEGAGFATAPVLEEPYVLVVAAGDPLAATGAPVPVAALADRGVVDYRELRAVHHPLQRLPRTARPAVVARSDDGPTILALVAAGHGVAVLPRSAVDTGDARLTTLALDPPVPPRRVALAWRRDRAPDGLDVLLEAARAAAR